MEKLQIKNLINKLLFLALLSSCQKEESDLASFSGLAMTMPYHIQIANLNDSRSKIEKVIKESFDEIDALFNHWNPHSEISYVNQNMSAYLSVKLSTFLQEIAKIVTLSEGKFDPTYGCWNELEFEGQYLKKGKAYFTFDGIAKGAALDLLASKLTSLGYRSFTLDWAGEIVINGHHPSGRPWRFAIANCRSNDEIYTVDMCGGALATSGNYWHRKASEKRLITHIFDPIKQEYLTVADNHPTSVTVKASNGTFADAFATMGLLWESDWDLFAKKIKELDSEAELLSVQY